MLVSTTMHGAIVELAHCKDTKIVTIFHKCLEYKVHLEIPIIKNLASYFKNLLSIMCILNSN
jgi:hypothetical protein